jgi:hypothetical protein
MRSRHGMRHRLRRNAAPAQGKPATMARDCGRRPGQMPVLSGRFAEAAQLPHHEPGGRANLHRPCVCGALLAGRALDGRVG